MSLKRIRRELNRRGYTEEAIAGILEWYQPSNTNLASPKKKRTCGKPSSNKPHTAFRASAILEPRKARRTHG